MQRTNTPKNNTEHMQNSAQAADVTCTQTVHMQDSAQEAKVMKTEQNRFKTVRKKLT